MNAPSSTRLRRVILPATLLAGDTLFVFAGLALGYWLRYASRLRHIGIDVPDATFAGYLPLLLLGAAFLIAAYAHLNLYEEHLLLRKFQSLNLIVKGTTFWLAAYLGLSLVLKFEPPISRLFVVMAFCSVLAVMFLWRSLFYRIITAPRWSARLRQRVAVLGWNDEARHLAESLAALSAHPLVFVGAIPLPGDPGPPPRALGPFDQLDQVLRDHAIDVLIAARADLARDQLLTAVAACERAYAEWKVIPSSFQILLSGLRLQTIGRVPVLGVESLALDKLFNRALKRAVDLLGAAIGLVLASPLLVLLALLVKRESPAGPVFFRQIRVGAAHRPFALWKLRSMRPDAEAEDHRHQSTLRGDPRLLRIGTFMRRWNLDEIPQFWNVLRGDMSLVGPRPERPHHVDLLSQQIPHYLPRHRVKPGMTGWAQVNGLRGDSPIDQRIRHDIYYIENWSLWLDCQILALTFVRWRNAY